jgi:hypothetical protein
MDGGTGDGRLDLDDHGSVVEAATSLDDAPSAEVLDDGRGRSWRERLDDSGATAWARRHRLALGAAAGLVVLAGAGAVAWTVWVPPPLDPQLHVAISELIPEQVVIGDIPLSSTAAGPIGADGRARAAYGLTPTEPDDRSSYTVLGLVGPVVRASSANPHAADGGDVPVAADVDVVIDCLDPDALDPAPGSYRLRVARTDVRGRTLVATVPVPDGQTGWPVYVSSTCAGQQTVDGLELRRVDVRDTGRIGVVRLDLDVLNRLPVDVTATTMPEGGYPAVSSGMVATPIAAGATARLPMDLTVHDCTRPTLFPIGVSDPDDADSMRLGGAPGAYLTLDLRTRASAAERTSDPVGGAEVHWSAATARQIDSALARACAGAPRAPQVRIAAVGSPVAARRDLPGTFETTDTDVFLVLRVTTPGRRATVYAPATAPESWVGSGITTASGVVRDGGATLMTLWSFSCEGGGFSPPPTVGVSVATADGIFQYQAQLNSSELARAVLDGCPGADRQLLVDSGWRTPAPPEMRRLMPGP